jgi:hypothetical protein
MLDQQRYYFKRILFSEKSTENSNKIVSACILQVCFAWRCGSLLAVCARRFCLASFSEYATGMLFLNIAC